MSANAMQTAAEFVQNLAGDLNKGDLELPMFPDSVIRIQQELRAEDIDINNVVRIISSDPALAARILQLSNAAAMRGAAEITDVRQAVVRVGARLVQSSAVAFAIRQAEKSEGLSRESKEALREIWDESVELAARCYVICTKYTKLNANEGLLTGLLSVLGRLYIFMKSQDYQGLTYTELDSILADWHPAICKAIAESWNLSDDIVNALETQLETNLALRGKASLAEVLSAARLILHHQASNTPLAASDYPLLRRLGIANDGDGSLTLDQHAAMIDVIRQGLKG